MFVSTDPNLVVALKNLISVPIQEKIMLKLINNSSVEANKTKEITAVKEVSKCDLNYHKIW